MEQRYSYLWMLIPLIALLAVGLFLFVERSGIDYEISYPPMEFLPPNTMSSFDVPKNASTKTLVLYNSAEIVDNDDYIKIVTDTLDSMKVEYETIDVLYDREKINLDGFQAVVITIRDLDSLGSELITITDWEENGGRVMFSTVPDPTTSLFSIYRKLGIQTLTEDFVTSNGVEFTSDLLPGSEGTKMGTDFLEHDSLALTLEPESNVHMVSADDRRVPLLWDYKFGKGHFVFVNTNQFDTRSSRGTIGAAYSLLYDIFVYPVINSSMFFIDDFPSPIPLGQNEIITQEYGRDIQSFYVNVWWPDLLKLASKYGLKYSGGMIETYSFTMTPPFDQEFVIERHQYFGGLLLDSGGELGLHGYNHVPLCLEDAQLNLRYDYPPGWPSVDAMQSSITELHRFAKSIFPNASLKYYIPPSNVLCTSSRAWLPEVLPDLKIIASLYLEDEDPLVYVQEFTEAPDGIVELPRITSDYELDDFMKWSLINELALHYVNSHFVHPDDILSSDRNVKQQGWEYYISKFEEYVDWLSISAPGLRNVPAEVGAMAVQRYNRIRLETNYQNDQYVIALDNFYDEAWLMLRSSKKPISIDGGSITQITSNLYLVQALKPNISINFSE